MVQGSSKLKCVWLATALLAACGGGGGEKKPDVKKPEGGGDTQKDPPPKVETEEDRMAKRAAAAQAIVPEGSSCLPPALRETGAPKLELADVGGQIVVCATDIDTTRLLGPVACWKVGLEGSPSLSYMSGSPLPGHSVAVRLDGACARGYCIPDDAKPSDPVVHMAWSSDNAKVAVLAGDNVHIFDSASKTHESTFGIRGDAGVTNDPISIHWVGDGIFIEGADQGPNSNVWVFKPDGTAGGPIKSMDKKDPKPLSTYGGSFVVIDKDVIAIAEQGFSTLTEYTVSSGARTKHVRKLPKSPCKPAETADYWAGKTDALPPKCADYMTKNFASLAGADLLAGTKSFVVLLRGPRLGEIAVMDKKSLAEKSTLKLPWCDAAGADAAPAE